MDKTYRIQDEPRPSRLAQFATHPLWPLLGMMIGGVWLGWTWFVFNAFAVGSPTRWRELAWIIGGLMISAAIILVISYLDHLGHLKDEATVKYALLVLTVWRLGVGYVVFTLQARTIEIYEYYGGVLRNGLIVFLLGAFLGRPFVLEALPVTFLKLLLV